MSAKVVNTLNQLKVLILCGISVLLIQAGQAITKGGEMNVGKSIGGSFGKKLGGNIGASLGRGILSTLFKS